MDYRTARNAALCVGLLVCLGLSSQEAAAQECPADLNSDNVVDAADLAMLLGSWGPGPGAPADFNGDDIVNAADLAVLLGSWGPCVLDTGMVTVGNPGNDGENSGESELGGYGPDRICGAVDYEYNIGKFEVTAGQYTEFLNAVAATDTYELYNTDMWNLDDGCKIERSGFPGIYSLQ